MNWYLSGITYWLNTIGHIKLFFYKKKIRIRNPQYRVNSLIICVYKPLFLVTKPKTFSLGESFMSKIFGVPYLKNFQHFIQYTHPTENKTNAATEANPNPVADVSTISMSSLFLLKYWPTIKVAGSLVIATPMPKKKTNLKDVGES